MLKRFLVIRYYIIAVLAAFGIYVWALISGTRILGDDDNNKEQHTSGAHSFYHK